MFDKIVDMIIFIVPIIVGIAGGKYPVYPIATVLFVLGILYGTLCITKIRKGDLSAYVSITRAVIGCLAVTYPVIGNTVLVFLIWFSLAIIGLIYLAAARAERIQKFRNRPCPTTAIGKIKYKKEEKGIRRIFYRNPPKQIIPTYYVRKV